MRNTITEDQIKIATEIIAKKGLDVSVLKYDMQNSSTADHYTSDLPQWLAGLSDYGYKTLLERMERL